MRSVRFHEYGDASNLVVSDVPTPEPGRGQILIRVAAAPVHSADAKIVAGRFPLPAAGPDGYALGFELGGVVESRGPEVVGFAPGDVVVGFSDWANTMNGTQAEFVVLPADAVVPAPRSVCLAQAATFPLNGLVALQSLDAADVAAGSTVVVTGAAGGVGALIVQIAHQRGLRVIAIARRSDAAALSELGADAVLESPDEGVRQSADAVIDAAGLAENVLGLIRDDGVYVTLLNLEPTLDRGIRLATLHVRSDPGQLKRLAQFVDQGSLVLPVVKEVALEDVATAYRGLALPGRRHIDVLVP
jgi:NADPH2:quinone reductase